MDRIKVLDKEFALFIDHVAIDKAVSLVAQKMNEDLSGKDPLMLCILNGSFMFAADLMKRLLFPCQMSFVKLASYHGLTSSGSVKEVIGLNESIANRTVVLIEDIVDTGVTIGNIYQQLLNQNPREIRIATMFFKPEACQRHIDLHYVGMEIPDRFVVGYGLDYNGYGRNYKDVYQLVD